MFEKHFLSGEREGIERKSLYFNLGDEIESSENKVSSYRNEVLSE
jgi:hypothetical protein